MTRWFLCGKYHIPVSCYYLNVGILSMRILQPLVHQGHPNHLCCYNPVTHHEDYCTFFIYDDQNRHLVPIINIKYEDVSGPSPILFSLFTLWQFAFPQDTRFEVVVDFEKSQFLEFYQCRACQFWIKNGSIVIEIEEKNKLPLLL